MTLFSLTNPAVENTATFNDDTPSSVAGVSESQSVVGLRLLTDIPLTQKTRQAAINRAELAIWEAINRRDLECATALSSIRDRLIAGRSK